MRISVLFIFFFLFSQIGRTQTTQTNLRLVYQVSSVSGSNPTFNLNGVVYDGENQYDATNVNVGDWVYFIEADITYYLKITARTPTGVSQLAVTAIDTVGGVVPTPMPSQMGIVRLTNNYKLPTYISGLTDPLRAGMLADFQQKVDKGITNAEEITPFVGTSPLVPAASNTGKNYQNQNGDIYYSNGTTWTCQTCSIDSAGSYLNQNVNGVVSLGGVSDMSPGTAITLGMGVGADARAFNVGNFESTDKVWPQFVANPTSNNFGLHINAGNQGAILGSTATSGSKLSMMGVWDESSNGAFFEGPYISTSHKLLSANYGAVGQITMRSNFRPNNQLWGGSFEENSVSATNVNFAKVIGTKIPIYTGFGYVNGFAHTIRLSRRITGQTKIPHVYSEMANYNVVTAGNTMEGRSFTLHDFGFIPAPVNDSMGFHMIFGEKIGDYEASVIGGSKVNGSNGRLWAIRQNKINNITPLAFDWIRIDPLDGTQTGDKITLYDKYKLPNAQPSIINLDKSVMIWTGNGTNTTPSFALASTLTDSAGAYLNKNVNGVISLGGMSDMPINTGVKLDMGFLDDGRWLTIGNFANPTTPSGPTATNKDYGLHISPWNNDYEVSLRFNWANNSSVVRLGGSGVDNEGIRLNQSSVIHSPFTTIGKLASNAIGRTYIGFKREGTPTRLQGLGNFYIEPYTNNNKFGTNTGVYSAYQPPLVDGIYVSGLFSESSMNTDAVGTVTNKKSYVLLGQKPSQHTDSLFYAVMLGSNNAAYSPFVGALNNGVNYDMQIPATEKAFSVFQSKTGSSYKWINVDLDGTQIGNKVSFYNRSYSLANAIPSNGNGNKSVMLWTGDGVGAVPSFALISTLTDSAGNYLNKNVNGVISLGGTTHQPLNGGVNSVTALDMGSVSEGRAFTIGRFANPRYPSYDNNGDYGLHISPTDNGSIGMHYSNGGTANAYFDMYGGNARIHLINRNNLMSTRLFKDEKDFSSHKLKYRWTDNTTGKVAYSTIGGASHTIGTAPSTGGFGYTTAMEVATVDLVTNKQKKSGFIVSVANGIDNTGATVQSKNYTKMLFQPSAETPFDSINYYVTLGEDDPVYRDINTENISYSTDNYFRGFAVGQNKSDAINNDFKWISVDFSNNLETGNKVGFYNRKYFLPNATPSITNGTEQIIVWTGNGINSTSTFKNFVIKSMKEENVVATTNQTAFTIAVALVAPNGTDMPLRVYVNGVRLTYTAGVPSTTQFTYTGVNVTLATGLLAGDVVTFEYLN